ncbi:hypothetical protein RND71_025005 [Anisodus tanguticus]|uniref:Uncharacterized protein n=1 Tax=Anisodus tanguticus TaxID=243964 RepID=A0AAE1VC78_9SOLA|nr:hypothetical protein RND71_025005 [Anisodus tanguticus]
MSLVIPSNSEPKLYLLPYSHLGAPLPAYPYKTRVGGSRSYEVPTTRSTLPKGKRFHLLDFVHIRCLTSLVVTKPCNGEVTKPRVYSKNHLQDEASKRRIHELTSSSLPPPNFDHHPDPLHTCNNPIKCLSPTPPTTTRYDPTTPPCPAKPRTPILEIYVVKHNFFTSFSPNQLTGKTHGDDEHYNISNHATASSSSMSNSTGLCRSIPPAALGPL